MQSISTIGLDIAKSVFQVHGVDAAGQVVLRRQLRRRYASGRKRLFRVRSATSKLARNACENLLAALLEVDDFRLRFVAGLVNRLWPEGRIGIVLDPELNSFRELLTGDLARQKQSRVSARRNTGSSDDLPIAVIPRFLHLAAKLRHPVTCEVVGRHFDAIEDTRGSEDLDAIADAHSPGGRLMRLADEVEDLRVALRGVNAQAPRHV